MSASAIKRTSGGLLNHANEQNQSPVDHARSRQNPFALTCAFYSPIIALLALLLALDTCLFHDLSKTVHPGSDHPYPCNIERIRNS